MSKKSNKFKPYVGKSGEIPAVEQFDNMQVKLEEQSKMLDQALSDAPTPMPPVQASEYTIIIKARGPHHNADAKDANRIIAKAVTELRAGGHEIVSATFNNGAEECIEGELIK